MLSLVTIFMNSAEVYWVVVEDGGKGSVANLFGVTCTDLMTRCEATSFYLESANNTSVLPRPPSTSLISSFLLQA